MQLLLYFYTYLFMIYLFHANFIPIVDISNGTHFLNIV